MSAELAGLAGIFAFSALWEMAGSVRLVPVRRAVHRAAGRGWFGRLPPAARTRLAHAGLERRIEPAAFMRLRAAGGLAGCALAAVAAPVAPGRLAPIVAAGLIAGGLLAPDAWLERVARRRRREIQAALPDALDLVAVGSASGRSPVALMREIARVGRGALPAEVATAMAEIECGSSQAAALDALRVRTGVPELGAFAAALERSRRYGSPLADQLHAQAATLRGEERRRLEERAARAAPKIQLVIAMVLVPSALLMIGAALVAHSGALVGAF